MGCCTKPSEGTNLDQTKVFEVREKKWIHQPREVMPLSDPILSEEKD